MRVLIRLKTSSAVALAICAVAIAYGGFACSGPLEFNPAVTTDEQVREAIPSNGVVSVTSSGSYTATIETTKGTIEVDLYNDIAYIYVENFINLAQSGFYDGAEWHRVIPGFVIQTGINPDGRKADRFDDVFHPDMKHNDAGILSMANSGLNTNTSQFFITHAPAPHLDPYENGELKPCATPGVSCHAVFGKVTSGIEAVFNTRQDVGDMIESITIHEVENAEMAVEDMREDNQSGDVINVTSSGTYAATITTDKGVIEVDLYNDIAHIYVKNFVDLAQSGFYDGAQWHRVIPGFVIQTGINPDGNEVNEFDDVFHPDMKHNDAGILSMANRGLNTNTSQFFITHGPTPHLDPYLNGELKPCVLPDVSCHAVFGKVTSGIEAVFNTRQGDEIDSITIQERAQ